MGANIRQKLGKGITVPANSRTSYKLEFKYMGKTWRPRVKVSDNLDPKNIKFIKDFFSGVLADIARNIFDPVKTFPDYSLSKEIAKQHAGSVATIEDIINGFFDDDGRRKHYEYSTWINFKKKANGILIPRLGNIIANELKPSQVTYALIDQRDFTVSQKTINNEISFLRQVFRWHKGRDDDFNNTIFVGWAPLGAPSKGDEIDPFRDHEVQQILKSCHTAFTDKKFADQLYNTISVLYWQGMRISEALGLKWENVLWEEEKIIINDALVEGVGKKRGAKTEAGNRTIEMLGDTKKALMQQRMYTGTSSEFVFLNPATNEPYQNSNAFLYKWIDIVKCTNVKYRPPKQLRHSWATYAFSAGEDPKWIAGQLGHTDPHFTIKTYYRFLGELYPNAGKEIEKLRKYAPDVAAA